MTGIVDSSCKCFGYNWAVTKYASYLKLDKMKSDQTSRMADQLATKVSFGNSFLYIMFYFDLFPEHHRLFL